MYTQASSPSTFLASYNTLISPRFTFSYVRRYPLGFVFCGFLVSSIICAVFTFSCSASAGPRRYLFNLASFRHHSFSSIPHSSLYPTVYNKICPVVDCPCLSITHLYPCTSLLDLFRSIHPSPSFHTTVCSVCRRHYPHSRCSPLGCSQLQIYLSLYPCISILSNCNAIYSFPILISINTPRL